MSHVLFHLILHYFNVSNSQPEAWPAQPTLHQISNIIIVTTICAFVTTSISITTITMNTNIQVRNDVKRCWNSEPIWPSTRTSTDLAAADIVLLLLFSDALFCGSAEATGCHFVATRQSILQTSLRCAHAGSKLESCGVNFL